MTSSEPKGVDVVLVVKGAGTHSPDDTLNFFLKGFIPAIKSVGTNVKIRQKELADDFPKSPHTKEEHNHFTEITLDCNQKPENAEGKDKNGTKKIWVKEIYWENELVPSSPWKAFFIEWQMASFALRRLITLSYLWLRKQWTGDWFFAYLVSFTTLYFVFGNFFLEAFQIVYGHSLFSQSLFWANHFPDTRSTEVIFVLLVSLGIALAPSIMASSSWGSDIGHRKLSGLPGWLMILLSLSFFLFTEQYLYLVLTMSIPVLMANLLRSLLWKWRPYINSDYHVLEIPVPPSYEKKLQLYVPIVKLFYRFVIVLMLPVLFFILLIAKFLKVTRILGAIGDGIEKFISLALGGILGDVSSYAMDPAQAYRVRSVVESEIDYFSKNVDNIHVFSHSQGTAITFETLFTQLEEKHRKKIKSYITIGSILSYYHADAPILEYAYPPTRFRLDEYPVFADGFQWINCWNLLDPITDFQGLDEFDHKCDMSPQNIKTRARFHSDYWVNVQQVHVPFVNRILGLRDTNDFWEKHKEIKKDSWISKFYGQLVLGFFLLVSLIMVILFRMYMKFFDYSIIIYAGKLREVIEKSLAESGTDTTFFSNLQATSTYQALEKTWEYVMLNIGDILLGVIFAYLISQVLVSIFELLQNKKKKV